MCVPMTPESFKEFAETNLYFICPRCAAGDECHFDWIKALQRYVYNAIDKHACSTQNATEYKTH